MEDCVTRRDEPAPVYMLNTNNTHKHNTQTIHTNTRHDLRTALHIHTTLECGKEVMCILIFLVCVRSRCTGYRPILDAFKTFAKTDAKAYTEEAIAAAKGLPPSTGGCIMAVEADTNKQENTCISLHAILS